MDTFEVVLGAFNNKMSAIRNSVGGDHMAESEEPDLLSCSAFR